MGSVAGGSVERVGAGWAGGEKALGARARADAGAGISTARVQNDDLQWLWFEDDSLSVPTLGVVIREDLTLVDERVASIHLWWKEFDIFPPKPSAMNWV